MTYNPTDRRVARAKRKIQEGTDSLERMLPDDPRDWNNDHRDIGWAVGTLREALSEFSCFQPLQQP